MSKEQYQYYCALHRRNKDGALILLDIPCTNLFRSSNRETFASIEKLLTEAHAKFL